MKRFATFGAICILAGALLATSSVLAGPNDPIDDCDYSGGCPSPTEICKTDALCNPSGGDDGGNTQGDGCDNGGCSFGNVPTDDSIALILVAIALG